MLGGLFQRDDADADLEQRAGWEWFADSGGEVWADQTVNRSTAMQLLAVHGCVRMISESIATMPPDTFRQTVVDEVDTRVPTSAPRWMEHPSNDLDWTSFMSQVLTGLLLDGNSYIRMTRNRAGELSELLPISSDRVGCVMENRQKVIRVDGAAQRKGSILHIPGMMLPGAVVGLSPLEYARQTIGLGLAAVEFGAGWFARDGNMPGVIELPRLAQPDTMRKMAQQWKSKRTRAGKGMPGVLDDGAQWKATGVTSEQMQFLQTRSYSATEVAGQLFLLDPTDLGLAVQGSSISYANLDQRNVRRIQVTFMPWIVRIEKAFTDLLPNKQFMKLNTNALLRGDTKSRYDSYKVGIESGFLEINEVREMEDRLPLDDPEPPAPPAEPPVPTDD